VSASERSRTKKRTCPLRRAATEKIGGRSVS
jgi:hypothetical protein